MQTTKGIQEGKGIDTLLVLGGAALVGVLGCLALMPNLWEKVKSYFPGPPKEELGKEELGKELEVGKIYRITYNLQALTPIFRTHQAVRPEEYLAQFARNVERTAPWLHIIKFDYSTTSGFLELSRVTLTCNVVNATLLTALEIQLNSIQKDYHWTTSQMEELRAGEITNQGGWQV